MNQEIASVILKTCGDPYGKPTDVIGFGLVGRKIANVLLPMIGEKEICFFDEETKSDEVFHYLDFSNMVEKTEIMVFTVELSKKYYKYLNKLNKNVKIFILKDLKETILVFLELGFGGNLVLL